MTPFVKVLRVADNGKSNLSDLCTGFFDVKKMYDEMGNDAASWLEKATNISFVRLNRLVFDGQKSLDDVVNSCRRALATYQKDCVQDLTLAAAMVDPQLVYREGGAWEVPGGMEPFRSILEIRCNSDVDKASQCMAALSAMRLFRRPEMAKLAMTDVDAFWYWAGTDPDAKMLCDVMAVPLLSAVGASSCVERMHKKCNIIKSRYSNQHSDKNVLQFMQLQNMWDTVLVAGKHEVDVFDAVAHEYYETLRKKRRQIADVNQIKRVLDHAMGTGSFTGGSDVVHAENLTAVLTSAAEVLSLTEVQSMAALLGVDNDVDDDDDEVYIGHAVFDVDDNNYEDMPLDWTQGG